MRYLRYFPIYIFISIGLISCGEDPVSPGMENDYDFSALNSTIQENLEVFDGGLVVLVYRDDRSIYKRTEGNLTSTMRLPVASASKWISGAVMLSLADQGYFSIDDTVGAFLPAFIQHGKGHITIRQLFSHTSGIQQPVTVQDPVFDYFNSLESSVQYIAEEIPLVSDPGSEFFYGGRSMHVGGRLAEVATGKSWIDLFRETVGAPCFMNRTDYGETENYRISGGVRSTADDYMNFLLMVKAGGMCGEERVMDESSADLFFRDQTIGVPYVYTPFPSNPSFSDTPSDTVRYGFGTWLDVKPPGSEFATQASSPGAFGTYPWIDLERNIAGIIFTSNSWPGTAEASFEIIRQIRLAADEFDENQE